MPLLIRSALCLSIMLAAAANWGAVAHIARRDRDGRYRAYARFLLFWTANGFFLALDALAGGDSAWRSPAAWRFAYFLARSPFSFALVASAFYLIWAWARVPLGAWVKILFWGYAGLYLAIALAAGAASAFSGELERILDAAYTAEEALTIGLVGLLMIPSIAALRSGGAEYRKASILIFISVAAFGVLYATQFIHHRLQAGSVGLPPGISFELAYIGAWSAASLFLVLRRAGRAEGRQARDRLDSAPLGEEYSWSPREAQIASFLLRGWSNKAIAIELGIGETTIKAHLTSLYQKTGVQSRFEFMNRIYTEAAER
jgi:DNA-binding CsgD family transcriptional regulator